MKRVLVIITIAILILILMVSCTNSVIETNNSFESTAVNDKVTSSNAQTELPIVNAPAPPQPLTVANVEEAVKMITIKDYYRQVYSSTYPYAKIDSEEIAAYEAMIQTIASCGYLPLTDCYLIHDTEITLFPGGSYEDVGVKCTCDCGDRIDCFIYLLNEEYITSSSITEYWAQRFGSQYLADATVSDISVNSQLIKAAYYPYGGRNAVSFLLDNLEIRLLYATDVDITKTIESFDYAKIPLE